MAAIVFPLLLVFGALGGMLVIVGRRLPEIRDALKAEGGPSQGAPQGELSLAPRSATLSRPTGTVLSRSLTGAREWGRLFLRGFGRSLTRAARGVGRVGRVFLRLFTRPPAAERIPQPGTRNGSLEAAPGAVAPKPPVPTTTDVRRSPSRPLRMPEPLPGTAEEAVAPEVAEPALSVPPPEQTSEASETTVPARSSVADSDAGGSPPRVVEDVPVGPERSPATQKPERVPHVPHEEPAVTVETTREVRTPRRRKVMGRVRTRKAGPPPAEPEEQRSRPGVSAHPEERPAAWVSTSQTIPALIGEGQLGHAESLLIDILSKNPRDTEAYRLLGMIYLQRQEYLQAREVFEEALRRSPGHPGIHGLLGNAHFSLGEYGKALSMYQRAHDAEETNVEYLEKLLTIFSRMDRQPMVRVTAKKILALNPNHEEAKKVLARAGVR